MKLALCLEYPIGQFGGTEALVKELLRGLAGKHELVLVSADTPATLAQSGWKDVLAAHIPHRPDQIGREAAAQLANRINGLGVQLAHFHLGGNFGWGNRFPGHCPIPHLNHLGIPCLSTVHSVGPILDGFCGPQRSTALKLAMLPLAWAGKLQQLRHVRIEIAVSQHDVDKMRSWYWPLRSRYTQIYHSRLHHDSTAPVPNPREDLILNVGHIAWRKGQVYLAEAFAQIAARYPTWKLMLAGHRGDESEDRIRAIAQTHGLEQRILLVGQRDDALALMHRAAIYVQPSNYEALGLALQEAMYCGTACIGTCVGGIPELLAGTEMGLLVEPRNVSQLAAALEQLLANPALRQKLGRAAAASIVARGMTAEAMLEQYLRLYDSFARKH